ncbi:hypothetical protein OAI64_02635 [Schleiferiaceae bacterium]|nr:hypothetical protein [Schleiferiaceae bacterium]
MKKLILLYFMIGFSLMAQGQTLTIDLYTDPDDNYVNLLTPTTDANGTVTIKVNNPSINATLGTVVLTAGGNGYSAGDDLIIDGNGISEIIMDSDVAEASALGRSITITNTGKVYFKGGAFKSTGSNGPLTVVIGEDGMSSSGVTTLEFDTEPQLNGGIYEIAAGTIIDDVGVTFPANANGYSKVKYTTYSYSTPSAGITPTFQTYVPNDGDKMICSPTDNGFTTVSATNTSGGSITMNTGNLYYFNASTASWATSPSSGTLTTPGKGFFGWVGSATNTTGQFLASSPAIISVTGDPNESFIYSLGYTTTVATGASGSGWNLLANPFPATLEWFEMSSLLTDVNNAIYIWDPSDNTYDYWVNGVSAPSGSLAGSSISNGLVAPMQSFWVQATSSSATIGQITSEDNTSMKSTTSVYKTAPDNLILVLQNTGDSSMYDVSWIKNMTNTSIEFEGDEDAWKYKNPNKPSIYTTDSLDEGMAINSVDLANHHYIPFTIETYLGGTYTLNLEKVVVNPNAYQVYLLDTELNTTHDFSSGAATLSLDSAAIYDDRFALFATTSSTVGLDELNPTLDWKAISTKDGILVSLDQSDVQYELIDINGRTLSKGGFDLSTFIPVERAGVKILRVWCAEGSAVKKFNVIKY